MPDIDYGKLFADLKDAVLEPVKAGSKKFLEDNKDARDFLEDRAKRLAELGVEFAQASDAEERKKILAQLEVVQQSIRNELSQVALGAAIESRNLFSQALNTAVGVLIKVLPVLVSII